MWTDVSARRNSTLKMKVIRSSETSVHIWTTRRYIPDSIIHNYRCENLKSCVGFWSCDLSFADRGVCFLRNAGALLRNHTVSECRKPQYYAEVYHSLSRLSVSTRLSPIPKLRKRESLFPHRSMSSQLEINYLSKKGTSLYGMSQLCFSSRDVCYGIAVLSPCVYNVVP
jgi:hypothetical protein